MQNYTARVNFSNEEEVEILVSSSRCHYHVWIGEETILLGPGVREVDEPAIENNSNVNAEDLAILTVLLFENGLWPKE